MSLQVTVTMTKELAVTACFGLVGLSSSLASGKVYIGNASGIAEEQAISGDATLTAAGVLTLANTAVTPAVYTPVTSITVDSKGRLTAASSALASGKFILGNGSGVAAVVAMSGDATMDNAGALTLANTAVTAGAYIPTSITVDSKGRLTAASQALLSGRVIVGNSLNVAAVVAISGDATLADTGALTLANTAVTPGTYNPVTSITVDSKGRLTAASKALASASFILGNGSGVAAIVTMSGDATMDNAGALTLADTGVSAAAYTNADITVDSKGRITAAASGSAGIGGSGTTNMIAKFSAATTLADSQLFDDGSFLGINKASGLTFHTTIKGNQTNVFQVLNALSTLNNREIISEFVGSANPGGTFIQYTQKGIGSGGPFLRIRHMNASGVLQAGELTGYSIGAGWVIATGSTGLSLNFAMDVNQFALRIAFQNPPNARVVQVDNAMSIGTTGTFTSCRLYVQSALSNNNSLFVNSLGAGILSILDNGVVEHHLGTAPALGADRYKLYAADHSGAGTCTLHMINEQGHIIKLFQGAVLTADVGGTADAIYSATEQNLINNHTTRINEIEARLQAHGLIA